MKVFYENELSVYLAHRTGAVKDYVDSQSAEYLLNVDEDEFVAHLEEKFQPPMLEIMFDDPSITTAERQIPAREHPSDFMRSDNWVASRQVFTYHLPFVGDSTVLRCQPNPRVMNTCDVCVDERAREVTFEVIDFYGSAEKVKQAIDHPVNLMKAQMQNVTANLDTYRASLPETMKQLVTARRQELKKRADTVALLGIPVKAKDSFPDTFAIPVTRKQVFEPPATGALTKKPDPHPVLSDAVYERILKVIWDMGRAMERLPSTYSGKDEESLRDHLIMMLEPQFEGHTTGETFNKSGKTDILVCYEKTTVFIAECKFWGGRKAYLEAIDQLLGYLTWRDSKAAVVVFARNKDISKVLAEIAESTPTHTNYVATLEERDEAWTRYTFHINGDPSRHLTMSVLVFHLPD